MVYVFNTKSVQNLLYIKWQRISSLANDYLNGHSVTHHFRMLYQKKYTQ